jgi:hypothetical protein
MKKILILFPIFLVVFVALYFFWPFHKRSFAADKSFTVSLSDNGAIFSVATNSKTVSDFLKEKNISLGNKDYIFPDPSAKIFPGSRITIQHAIPVVISADGKDVSLNTTGKTVGDALTEAGLTLSPVDKIVPGISATLSANLKIIVTRINIAEITANEDIPFQTVQKEDNTVLWKHNAVKQAGTKGVREKKYRVTYTNGKETNRVLIGATITQPPITEIDVVGTKIIVGKTQQGDATWYANGNDLTCASLDFAHGKYLRVTNRTNGKSVIVLVNDSGPYGKGRVIDLNKPAFKKIADLGSGVINVKVEEILN